MAASFQGGIAQPSWRSFSSFDESYCYLRRSEQFRYAEKNRLTEYEMTANKRSKRTFKYGRHIDDEGKEGKAIEPPSHYLFEEAAMVKTDTNIDKEHSERSL